MITVTAEGASKISPADLSKQGAAARVAVRLVWPDATSCYEGKFGAEVYDPQSKTVLGRAEAYEFAVEHAWIDAANALKAGN
jgi:hypothetical protein